MIDVVVTDAHLKAFEEAWEAHKLDRDAPRHICAAVLAVNAEHLVMENDHLRQERNDCLLDRERTRALMQHYVATGEGWDALMASALGESNV